MMLFVLHKVRIFAHSKTILFYFLTTMVNVKMPNKDWWAPARRLDWWVSWLMIAVGCTVMAAGFVFFINPYNIVPGGVYGASIVLHNIFPSIQVGTFGYMFDIPLLILSAVLLGARLGSRTLFAALFTPLVMNFLTWISYPDIASMHALDPAALCGGVINMKEHLMLATIIGATMIGVGCGVVVRNQATTGGTDIVAMILHKYTHLRFSTGILLCDAVVVLFGLLVIGFGGASGDASTPSWHLSFYSLIAIFVAAKVIAYVINGSQDDKLIFIISEQPNEELRAFILETLDRSATRIKSSGLYTNNEKQTLFLVVSNKELPAVKAKIQEVDPLSFVVVTDAHAAYGEGWKPLPIPGELHPE